MVKTKEYSEAMVEVLDVIQHLDEETISRIPISLIKTLNEKKSTTYKSTIDFSKELKENELKHETKVILALIYRDYICETEAEKHEFESQLVKPKVITNNIFKAQVEEKKASYTLIPIEKRKNILQRIIDKFLSKKIK